MPNKISTEYSNLITELCCFYKQINSTGFDKNKLKENKSTISQFNEHYYLM